MRLWHKDLLEVLPRKQLISQWRECCCIATNLAVYGTPRHLLVNKILNYSSDHFIHYCNLVVKAMRSRGYTVNDEPYSKCIENIKLAEDVFSSSNPHRLFEGWFNDRYLLQCICNLQEKYDCDGISDDEWDDVLQVMRKLFIQMNIREIVS